MTTLKEIFIAVPDDVLETAQKVADKMHVRVETVLSVVFETKMDAIRKEVKDIAYRQLGGKA